MPKRCAAISGRLAAWLMAAMLVGCSSVQHVPVAAVAPPMTAESNSMSAAQGRRIVVFFDGTHNDESSDTNIKRLHSLVTLQDRDDIASIYLQGVGVSVDAIGAATGAGINERVRIGYEFVYNHYRPGDKVYIFGFSRGAYSARQLSAMLYFGGLPPNPANLDSHTVAEEVHRAVFPVMRADIRLIRKEDRWHWARKRLAESPLFQVSAKQRALPLPDRAREHYEVDVEVLGLWDTVEALGAPNELKRFLDIFGFSEYIPNIDEPNARYAENLCNVRYAFQALSIDDDREWIFTPVLISRKHLFEGCLAGRQHPPMLDGNHKVIPGHLQEVWFSGAHSDVGGGYQGSQLSGVSLNWMMGLLHKLALSKDEGGNLRPGILREGTWVREDPFGTSHDPERSMANGLLYHRKNRDLVGYTLDRPDGVDHETQQPLDAFKHQLCVHESVFQRRHYLPLRDHENGQLVLKSPGEACLGEHEINRDFRWAFRHEVPSATEGCKVQLKVNRYPDCPLVGDLPSMPRK